MPNYYKKPFVRDSKNHFEYHDDYTIPDQSRSIGDLLERHMSLDGVTNHENEAVVDTDIDSPMRYDTELTDIPTKYQDKEYFDHLESLRKGVSQGSLDTNPRNLNSDEKVSESSAQIVSRDSPSGEGS